MTTRIELLRLAIDAKHSEGNGALVSDKTVLEIAKEFESFIHEGEVSKASKVIQSSIDSLKKDAEYATTRGDSFSSSGYRLAIGVLEQALDELKKS